MKKLGLDLVVLRRTLSRRLDTVNRLQIKIMAGVIMMLTRRLDTVTHLPKGRRRRQGWDLVVHRQTLGELITHTNLHLDLVNPLMEEIIRHSKRLDLVELPPKQMIKDKQSLDPGDHRLAMIRRKQALDRREEYLHLSHQQGPVGLPPVISQTPLHHSLSHRLDPAVQLLMIKNKEVLDQDRRHSTVSHLLGLVHQLLGNMIKNKEILDRDRRHRTVSHLLDLATQLLIKTINNRQILDQDIRHRERMVMMQCQTGRGVQTH